ncbi:MAG: cytochrome c family protein [candidate division Zixibacteria bacterium]|nr:cytochrome c family protein [candidate division Zixibacteria bacterium]MDH3936402.1 cytochrome c family protein [candidate division Zixibacteria bacterium]MDH4032175.1 cytochrome c family protein [candidate division Zixibacteria bacterium]
MSNRNVGPESKAREWKSPLAILVAGAFLFLAISGVAIYFFGFSVTNQFMVLFHTALGLAFVLPYIIYQIRHYLYSRQFNLTDVKLLGYTSFAAVAVCSVSGLVLTWQPIFGTRISYLWDTIHTVSGLVSIALVLLHVALLVARYSARTAETSPALNAGIKRFVSGSSLVATVSIVLVVLAVYAYVPVPFANEFPEDYVIEEGKTPFQPSLALTASGGAYDPRTMADSKDCGESGCHEQIYQEWLPSAHRYASMDAAFQVVQNVMAKNNGPVSTRYCGGCHDPIALFSGSKNLYTDDLSSYGADEGVSCVACHSIESTDVKGNANYVITQPERYVYEFKEGATAKFLRNFLIRAYPQHHVESFTRDLYKTPEYCGACHKQFIDEEINKVGWVQLQNQYDNWKNSRWYHEGDPEKTVACRECHMQLLASTDPARGDGSDYNRDENDGSHRSHRFLGANQFMPLVLKLPGAEEHVKLVESWMRGETDIPEIADKWAQGPAIPVEVIVSEKASPGDTVSVQVSMLNNKAGHDFPTGPLDIIQAWVELDVTDQEGNVIFTSGEMDDRNFLKEGTFIFKAEGIDQYGNLIDRHNLWEMVGARFKRALFPGFSDVAEYRFICPSTIRGVANEGDGNQTFEFEVPAEYDGALKVSASLAYRKVGQFLMNFLFTEEAGLTASVTRLSEDSKTIWVQK